MSYLLTGAEGVEILDPEALAEVAGDEDMTAILRALVPGGAAYSQAEQWGAWSVRRLGLDEEPDVALRAEIERVAGGAS